MRLCAEDAAEKVVALCSPAIGVLALSSVFASQPNSLGEVQYLRALLRTVVGTIYEVSGDMLKGFLFKRLYDVVPARTPRIVGKTGSVTLEMMAIWTQP